MSVAEFICYVWLIGPAIVLIMSIIAVGIYLVLGVDIDLKVFRITRLFGQFLSK